MRPLAGAKIITIKDRVLATGLLYFSMRHEFLL